MGADIIQHPMLGNVDELNDFEIMFNLTRHIIKDIHI